MIYLDTSVALAELFAEDRRPPEALWKGPIFSSRLLEYEIWSRVYAMKRQHTHSQVVLEILQRVSIVEMLPSVLARALEPFACHMRTLDALHLSTAFFLRERGVQLQIASCDLRFIAAAQSLNFEIFDHT